MIIVTYEKDNSPYSHLHSKHLRFSNTIRAIGLDLESDFPIIVQFRHHSKSNPSGTYAYQVQKFVQLLEGDDLITTKEELIELFDFLVFGGYTDHDLAHGTPGARLSSGALVKRLLVAPSKGTEFFKPLDTPLINS